MEMAFQKNAISYLKSVLVQQKCEELTQQIRLSDSMPDIGQVIGCWGQILIRGKEWRSDSIGVSGGVIAWVLYQPEGDGEPCCVDAWIPFQTKWDIDEMERDGTIEVCTSLCHIDTRMLSDRKLIVRVNVGLHMHAFVSDEAIIHNPAELQEEVELLQRTYPIRMPIEAGEKQFDLEQQLEVPPDGARVHKIIRLVTKPRLTEYKIVADKLVLRGNADVYVLYMDDFNRIHNNTWTVPFSQYSQMDREYEPAAEVCVCFEITQLDVEIIQPDQLSLKLGFIAQYTVFSVTNISISEDMYSLNQELKLEYAQIELPAVVQMGVQDAQIKIPVPDGRVLDLSVMPVMPAVVSSEETANIELVGSIQMLYQDPDGQVQVTSERWQKTMSSVKPLDSDYNMRLMQVNTPRCDPEIVIEMQLEEMTTMMTNLRMITGAARGEAITPDPLRPSIILRRSGTDSLWEIAKKAGTTEKLIKKANGLQGEPEDDQMLLIPVQ